MHRILSMSCIEFDSFENMSNLFPEGKSWKTTNSVFYKALFLLNLLFNTFIIYFNFWYFLLFLILMNMCVCIPPCLKMCYFTNCVCTQGEVLYQFIKLENGVISGNTNAKLYCVLKSGSHSAPSLGFYSHMNTFKPTPRTKSADAVTWTVLLQGIFGH